MSAHDHFQSVLVAELNDLILAEEVASFPLAIELEPEATQSFFQLNEKSTTPKKLKISHPFRPHNGSFQSRPHAILSVAGSTSTLLI